MKNFFASIVLVILIFSFVACEHTPIVHDLNERDANEIIVLLAKNNIKATKAKEERNQEIYWTIQVDPSDEVAAQGILVANDLPKIKQGGLEGICKDTSMIVTAETEKCRKLLAYKGEIINSLESIPGVVSADVVLNIPDVDEFPDENSPTKRPTAAVTVKYLTDANVKTKLTEGKIQEFVANSITGLDSRDVSVILSYLEQKMNDQEKSTTGQGNENVSQLPDNQDHGSVIEEGSESNLVSVGGIMMSAESAKKFKMVAALFLIVLLLLSGAFIFALFRMSKLRKQSSVPAVSTKKASDEDNDQKLLEA